MITQKATYWFALALAAFAFHGEYQRGAFPALHRAANCAGTSLCRLATNAERSVAMAKLSIARAVLQDSSVQDSDLLASLDARQFADAREIAEDQAEMAREEAQEQAAMLREQVRDQVRAEAEMLRAESQMRAQIGRIRVEIPQVHISNAANHRVIVMTPSRCPHSAVRVSVASIADSPDDDGDSN